MTTASALASSYYRDQLSARAAAMKDFASLWPLLDFDNLDGSFAGYASAMVNLIDLHRTKAADLANVFYQEMRQFERVPGEFDRAAVDDLTFSYLLRKLQYDGPIAIKRALRKGWTPERAMATAFAETAGDVTKLILDAGRDQIINNTRRDKQALAWMRVASPGACAFCAMLASRGPVYLSERSAGFEAHSHCCCYPRPMWTTDQALPSTTEMFQKLWKDKTYDGEQKDTEKNSSSNRAMNAFRRELYAHNNES